MNDFRLTFNSSTNFTVPISTYRILEGDAAYYGYTKNQKPNISGFLNDLIPALSDYQKDLYQELLKYNNGNAEIAQIVARSIHNVYLKPFTFHDDGVVSVPFRIKRDRYTDFTLIHDEYLRLYDTDFTNYLRTLLVEYSTKTLAQREYLYAFRKLDIVKKAIPKNKICHFYSKERCNSFVPISIDPSPVFDHNYIVGITSNCEPIAILLHDLQHVVETEEKIKITSELCNLANDHLDTIFEKEYDECLD